jgi:hypothetical protein
VRHVHGDQVHHGFGRLHDGLQRRDARAEDRAA